MGTYWTAVCDEAEEYIEPHAIFGQGAKIHEITGPMARFARLVLETMTGRWYGKPVRLAPEFEPRPEYKDVSLQAIAEYNASYPRTPLEPDPEYGGDDATDDVGGVGGDVIEVCSFCHKQGHTYLNHARASGADSVARKMLVDEVLGLRGENERLRALATQLSDAHKAEVSAEKKAHAETLTERDEEQKPEARSGCGCWVCTPLSPGDNRTRLRGELATDFPSLGLRTSSEVLLEERDEARAAHKAEYERAEALFVEIKDVAQERDEARAEVERLRTDCAQALADRLVWWQKGRREGAEAMREAAANVAVDKQALAAHDWSVIDTILALPLPGDKPGDENR